MICETRPEANRARSNERTSLLGPFRLSRTARREMKKNRADSTRYRAHPLIIITFVDYASRRALSRVPPFPQKNDRVTYEIYKPRRDREEDSMKRSTVSPEASGVRVSCGRHQTPFYFGDDIYFCFSFFSLRLLFVFFYANRTTRHRDARVDDEKSLSRFEFSITLKSDGILFVTEEKLPLFLIRKNIYKTNLPFPRTPPPSRPLSSRRRK